MLALAGIVVYDRLPSSDSSGSSTSIVSGTESTNDFSFGVLETRLLTRSWFDQNYAAPENYAWKMHNNKGRIPTKEWLQSIWEMAQSYDDGSKLSKSEQRNMFVRAAMSDTNINAAYLEKVDDTSGGVAFIVIYYDENNEIQTKEFGEDLISFNLDDPDEMDTVFVPPVKVVSAAETTSVLDGYKQQLDNATAAIKQLTQPAEQPATEQPVAQSAQPATKSKVTAFVPVSLDGTSPSVAPAAQTSKVPAFKPVSLD